MNELTVKIGAEITSAIQDGINSWKKAGELVIQAIDSGLSLQEIVESCNSEFITVEVLAQFERIGRGQVMPKFLVAPYPAARFIERLPMSEQRRLEAEGKVSLVVFNDGKPDVLEVAIPDLTKKQCKQVFTKSGVRSTGAQRAYIEDERMEIEMNDPAAIKNTPWVIKGGRVLFRQPCELNRQELTVLLAQMV